MTPRFAALAVAVFAAMSTAAIAQDDPRWNVLWITVDDMAHESVGVLLDALGLDEPDGADGRSFVPLLRGVDQDRRGAVFTQIEKISRGRDFTTRARHDGRLSYIWNA